MRDPKHEPGSPVIGYDDIASTTHGIKTSIFPIITASPPAPSIPPPIHPTIAPNNPNKIAEAMANIIDPIMPKIQKAINPNNKAPHTTPIDEQRVEQGPIIQSIIGNNTIEKIIMAQRIHKQDDAIIIIKHIRPNERIPKRMQGEIQTIMLQAIVIRQPNPMQNAPTQTDIIVDNIKILTPI